MKRKKTDEKIYFFDKPENVERFLKLLYVICGLLFVFDFIVHRHIVHSWEQVPGFYALYGFIACVYIIILAPLILVTFLAIKGMKYKKKNDNLIKNIFFDRKNKDLKYNKRRK